MNVTNTLKIMSIAQNKIKSSTEFVREREGGGESEGEKEREETESE